MMAWLVPSFFVLAGVLVALFAWSLYRPGKSTPVDLAAWTGEGDSHGHSGHISQLRQSLSGEDAAFLESRGLVQFAEKLRAERRLVAARYVEALHGDFRSIFQLGRTLAALSPEVAGGQEAERLWLALRFECRYQVVRTMLRLHASPGLQLERLAELTGILSRKLDAAMAELGERAVSAVEAISAAERRRVDLV
jgi:hypothetical protein